MTNTTPKSFVNFAGQVVRYAPLPGKPGAYAVTLDHQPIDFMAVCAAAMARSSK